jgi:RHS repeat-associated protein
MALSWWQQWAKRLTTKGRPGSRGQSRRLREKLHRPLQCERLEDRNLLAGNLFLQSMVTDGPNAPVGTVAADDTLAAGEELPVQFTTPAGFLSNGFAGGTFYLAYDASVFSLPTASWTGATTKTLTAAQAAEVNIDNNSVLSQSPGTSGFGVTVTDTTLTGSYHLVKVSVTNDADTANNITGSTGGVLFAINLQPAATTSSTNLCLYNATVLGRADTIYDATTQANAYSLGLPSALTTYNSTCGFQANVVGDNLPAALTGDRSTLSTTTAATTSNVSVAYTSDSSTLDPTGLQVTSVTGTPTGFTVTFNKPFAISSLHLYSSPTSPSLPDLLFEAENFAGSGQFPLSGSLVPNATDTAFTFVESTQTELLGGLPDGTYVVSLLSGLNGLTDTSGVPLDASNNPDPADNLYPTSPTVTPAYTTTFTLTNLTAGSSITDTNVALSLPAFTQGPGLSVNPQVPYQQGTYFGGIPVMLGDGDNLSTVSFQVTYNTALLTVTGAVVDPNTAASYPDATFTRTPGTPVSGMETDTFTFNSVDGPLAQGQPWTLGEVLATVPNVSGQHIYRATQLLPVTDVTADVGVALPVVGGSGFELVAYLGDGSGDGALTTADAAQADAIVGVVSDYNGVPYITEGFASYPDVDPAVVADTDASESVDGGAVAALALVGAGFPVPTIPTPPKNANVLPVTPQPADLSVPGPLTDGSLALASAGLSYVSGSDALVTIAGDFPLAPTRGTATLTGITAQATLDDIQGSPVDYSATGVTAGASYRFAAQIDAGSLPTGRYESQITITEQYSDGSQQMLSDYRQQDVLNWTQSPFDLGPGWSLSGVDYLVPDAAGASLVQGDGAMAYFWSNGDGAYRSEAGPYAFMTLAGSTASGFTLTGTSGTKETFDGQGELLTVTDRDGNTTTYTYSSGQLTSVADGSHHSTEYAYSGGHLSTMTDFAGRVTTLGYNSAGQLVSITLPDPATGIEGNGSPVTTFDYYTSGPLSGLLSDMTDADNNTTQYDYDASYKLLTAVVHADSTTEHYQSVQAAALMAASSAPVLASGVCATYTDQSVNTTTTALDSFGLPTSVSNALDQTTTYIRNADGLVTQMTQPDPSNGAQDSASPITTYQYDSKGDLTYEGLPDGSHLAWGYEAEADTPGGLYEAVNHYIDGLGQQTWYTIDPATGDVLDVEQVMGSTEDPDVDPITQYTYTPAPSSSSDPPGGLVASETDPLQNVTTYDYNAHGLLTQTTYAYNTNQPTFTQNGYDSSSDNLLTQTNELGYTTTYTYDNLGRMKSKTEPAPYAGATAPVLNYVYDNDGNVLKEIDGFGNTITFTYDSRDRLLSETDPDGHTTTYAYDGVGNLLSVTDAENNVTAYTYNALGWKMSVIPPNPLTGQPDSADATTYAYDNLGNLLSQTDPLGNTTSYTYNDRNECLTQTDPDGGTTTYTYDTAGNMVTMTDPDGNETRWTYDALNRVATETECVGTANQATALFGYDLAGDLLQTTDYNGQVVQYVYDDLGREIHENWMSGQTITLQMTFSYDAAGQLLSASDPSSATYTYTYDNDGNNTSVTASYAGLAPSVVLQNVYDTNGYLTDLYTYVGTTADFHNSYTYDADGSVMSVMQTANPNNAGNFQNYAGYNQVSNKYVTFTYTDDGQLQTLDRYADTGGTQQVADSTYSYDHDGNLTGLVESDAAGATLPTYGWTYDADNRVLQFSSSVDGTATYAYDDDSQVTSVSYSSALPGVGSQESFSYDANGNRNSSGYSTETGNRLQSDGTYTYQYDADGNCTCQTNNATGARTQYTWDYRNRLAEITYKDPQGNVTETIQYSYDVFNRWIGEAANYPNGGGQDSTQWFVYDGQNVVLQLNASGGVTERYLCGPAVDQVLAEENGSGVVSWLLADNQGSIRDVVQISDGQTTNVDHIRYGAYGQIAYQSNASYNPGIGYTGQYWDVAAGMYYCEARWYDPSTGRYISEDPTGFSAGDPNLYRYVFNDPTNLVDPTGEVYTSPSGEPFPRNAGDDYVRFLQCIESMDIPRSPTCGTAPNAPDDSTRAGMRSPLPGKGKPNSTDSWDKPGGGGTIRDFGPDGRATTDFDFGHDYEGAGDPHAHGWDWSNPNPRGPARPIGPNESPPAAKAVIVGGGLAAVTFIIANWWWEVPVVVLSPVGL